MSEAQTPTSTKSLIHQIFARAILETDFLGVLPAGTPGREVFRAATIATDEATEAWELEAGVPIGATVTSAVRSVVCARLLKHGEGILRRIENATSDALRDAIESGEVTARRNY